jgi:CheY-like chemotaxis protein
MGTINRLLLVEDHPPDIRQAAVTAESLGIPKIEARTSLQAAKDFLDAGLRGESELPDGIILDLDLGYESGYELLRFWHSTPRLFQIPVIVWSVLGDDQREMCRLFKVSRYVGKWEGHEALREALAELGRSDPS